MRSIKSTTLRAEARLLALAGVTTLAVSFPPTMSVAVGALISRQPPSMSALSLGGVALIAGYVACHLATHRLLQAHAGRR